MLYEIINPSDPYTIIAPDLEIATIACALLGRGQYIFKPLEEGGEEIPPFMFIESHEWCMNHFSMTLPKLLETVIDSRSEELADCLDSCLIGNQEERKEYEIAAKKLTKKEEIKFRYDRHDKLRTSLNDIGQRAYQIAKNLRDKVENPIIPAPQQVFGIGIDKE